MYSFRDLSPLLQIKYSWCVIDTDCTVNIDRTDYPNLTENNNKIVYNSQKTTSSLILSVLKYALYIHLKYFYFIFWGYGVAMHTKYQPYST